MIYDTLTSGHAVTARPRHDTITDTVDAPLMRTDIMGARLVHIEGHGWCPLTGGIDPVVTIDGRDWPYETQGSVARRQAIYDDMAAVCGPHLAGMRTVALPSRPVVPGGPSRFAFVWVGT